MSKLPQRLFCLLAVLFAVSVAGAEPIRVITTNAVLADFVSEVGGTHVRVEALVPVGADLHAFEPTPAQIRSLHDADVVIINGLGLEGWINKVIENSGYQGAVVEASRGVQPLAIEAEHADGDHQHEVLDPHAWMDVTHAIEYVRNIKDALAEIDPAHAEDYAAWADLYIAQLRVLDSWIKRQVSRMAIGQRVLIMDHDAFRYFAKAYGFETRSLRGVSRLSEPSARDVAEIVKSADAMVAAVFAESAANEKLLAQVAAEAGVAMGGRLYVEAAPTERGSYIDMMKHNVRTIANVMAAEE